MALEIERKFLVVSNDYRLGASHVEIRQGYICHEPDKTIRIRIQDHQAFLTLKGRTRGLVRSEFEYPIPMADALEMLDLFCQNPLIGKYRYSTHYEGYLWVIDEFKGANQGLVLAEIELDHPDQTVPMPPWVGKEVTFDHRYGNSHLSLNPWPIWRES